MARILCVGTISTDVTIVLNKDQFRLDNKNLILPIGAKLDIKETIINAGGSAINTAYSLINAGHQPTVLSQIGHDYNGKIILNNIHRTKIKSLLYSSKDIKTINSIILLYQLDRTILTGNVSIDYDNWVSSWKGEYDWIVLGPVHNKADKLYKRIQKEVAEKKTRLCIIPSIFQLKYDKDILRNLLRITDIFVSNEEEANLLTHNVGRRETLRRLCATIELYGPKIVAITKGKDGAGLKFGELFFELSAMPAEKKDATGAGDAFTSGLIAVLAEFSNWNNKVIEFALKIALKNSSSVITEIGATKGILSKQEYKKLWKQITD